MSTKAHIQTQAKTPAVPTAARIAQPRLAELEREVDRPNIAAQLEGAAWLGHSLGAISVRNAALSQIKAKPLIQRQELLEEDEFHLRREPAAIQRYELQGSPVAPSVEAAIQRAIGTSASELRQENRRSKGVRYIFRSGMLDNDRSR